jgi:predicted amidohydrolase YtcJ
MVAASKADLVLHGGVIASHPGSDSVAVSRERIIACGRFAEFKELIGPRTRMIRLERQVVAPGFIDCHLHFLEAASVAAGSSVLRCHTIAELLADLRIAAGKTPPGNWLRVFGCDESLLYDRRGPTRAELDQSTPKNPLRLRHQTLHASWLNSRAISLLGLEQPGFHPPPGGMLIRDAQGGLTGLIVGMEEWLSSRMGRVTGAELEARARVCSRELAAAGITSITDATVRNGPEDIATLDGLAASGAIVQRTSAMAGAQYLSQLPELRASMRPGGVRVAGIKFMGIERWKKPELADAVARALVNQFDCAFHCTEVEELEAALDAIAAARARISAEAPSDALCRIEHGGLVPPEYPERIAALDTWVVTNPGFIHYRGAKYAGEPGLIPYLYRARSLRAAGVRMAAASDAPVIPAKPFVAIAAAVSRTSMDGYELAPQEALDVPSALALFTSYAAQLSRLPAGTIEVGALADLIVLPSDPVSLSPPELLKLPVDMTIIGGQVVYERGRLLNRRQGSILARSNF